MLLFLSQSQSARYDLKIVDHLYEFPDGRIEKPSSSFNLSVSDLDHHMAAALQNGGSGVEEATEIIESVFSTKQSDGRLVLANLSGQEIGI